MLFLSNFSKYYYHVLPITLITFYEALYKYQQTIMLAYGRHVLTLFVPGTVCTMYTSQIQITAIFLIFNTRHPELLWLFIFLLSGHF